VSEQWQPSMGDICTAFRDLADELSELDEQPMLDAGVEQTIRHLLDDLEHFIPGLDRVPDADAGQAMARAARSALERGKEREAAVRALRGLSFSPHDPTLHYVLSSACFEAGSVELAFRLLCHSLWIHPGYQAARADLESLTAFLDGGDEGNERAA
jgi:hypothetical protein